MTNWAEPLTALRQTIILAREHAESGDYEGARNILDSLHLYVREAMLALANAEIRREELERTQK
jgi:hypothetical protein